MFSPNEHHQPDFELSSRRARWWLSVHRSEDLGRLESGIRSAVADGDMAEARRYARRLAGLMDDGMRATGSWADLESSWRKIGLFLGGLSVLAVLAGVMGSCGALYVAAVVVFCAGAFAWGAPRVVRAVACEAFARQIVREENASFMGVWGEKR